MKLRKLIIRGYKNLDIDLTLDEESPNYLTIIGLNGSGKSNVLEAISLIAQAYTKKTPHLAFEHYMKYRINDDIITLDNNTMYLNGNIRKTGKKDLLPKLIACYSGEDTRLWDDIYAERYQQYFKSIKTNTKGIYLKFLYVNKYSWDKALLTLLCHPKHQNDIADFLNINLQNVQIDVAFNSHYHEIRNEYRANQTGLNDFVKFVETLHSIDGTSYISRKLSENLRLPIAKLYINSFTTLTLNNLEISTSPDEWCQTLFNYLFIASMPKDIKLIEHIEFDFGTWSLKNLSEGQKKFILVECITRILADDKTIILLDEPDSHIHLDKKQEIIKAIEQAQGTSLLTSHSPTLTKGANPQSLYKLSNGKLEKINELYEGLSHLVTQQDLQKIFFSTKDLIICEGKTDELYITKALEIYKEDYPNLEFEFILLGGTDAENLKSLLKKFIGNQTRKIIVLTDRDDAGVKLYQKIFNCTTKKQDITYKKLNNCQILSELEGAYLLVLPITQGFSPSSNFMIEDYFGTEVIRDLAIRHIEHKFTDNSSYSEFPSVKNNIKSELLKEFCQNKGNKTNMTGFRVLLDKLNEIVELS